MKTRIVDREEDFFKLDKEWNELLSKSNGDTIFLTYEWLSNWWKNYKGADDKLKIILLEDDRSLHGIAPLIYEGRRKRLFFIGNDSGDSEYLDFIAETEYQKIFFKKILDEFLFKDSSWDVMHLSDIPENSKTLNYLENFCKEHGFPYLKDEKICSTVKLPSSWNEYLSGLNPRMRTKIRSKKKKLEDGFRVEFGEISEEKFLDESLNLLFQFHQVRWKKKGYHGSFSDRRRRYFYNDLSKAFLKNGWLRFYYMKLDNVYFAFQFCFEYKWTVSLLQEGFSEQYEEYEIGNVLRTYIFQELIERGIKEYDFLGGTSFHKKSWGAQIKRSINFKIYNKTRRGKQLFFISNSYKRAYNYSRDIYRKVMPLFIIDARRRLFKRIEKWYLLRKARKG